MGDTRWAPSMFVRRSHLSDDVWVPFDALDTPDSVPVHAGALQDVKAWAEQHTREEHEKYDIPLIETRWLTFEGVYVLEVRAGNDD